MRSEQDFFSYLYFLIFFISHFLMINAYAFDIPYPDFKTSMLREIVGSPEELKNRITSYEAFDKKYINLFHQNYERNIFEIQNSPKSETYRIPRIIHQIWLGSPVPKQFQEWMQTWAELEGWTYMLWTDENVKDIPMHNRVLYNNSTNYGEKSDILRLELLSIYGGVYADTDYECLKPEIFEELHKNFDFYIGFEPIEHGKINRFNIFKMCNALIGAVPNHPLVQDMIINMKANYLAYQSCGVLERTGPSYYTRMICEYAANDHSKFRSIYLPCTFFYLYMERELLALHTSSTEITLLPETAGIHYWTGSWHEKKNALLMKPEEENHENP